jgi:hypothetical protein
MLSLPVRVALALAALAVAAVLAVQAVGARADAELSRIVLSPSTPTAAQRARGRTLLPRAQRLNPDTRPDILGGLLRLRGGDARGAVAAFRGVVRREPENLEAWALIARIAGSQDPALVARARSRVRALAPPVR